MWNIYCSCNFLTGLTLNSFDLNITILQIALRGNVIPDFITVFFPFRMSRCFTDNAQMWLHLRPFGNSEPLPADFYKTRKCSTASHTGINRRILYMGIMDRNMFTTHSKIRFSHRSCLRTNSYLKKVLTPHTPTLSFYLTFIKFDCNGGDVDKIKSILLSKPYLSTHRSLKIP